MERNKFVQERMLCGVLAMQKELRGLDILVTENWTKRVNVLVVGVKARVVSAKIKTVIVGEIPIVRENDFLQGLKN